MFCLVALNTSEGPKLHATVESSKTVSSAGADAARVLSFTSGAVCAGAGGGTQPQAPVQWSPHHMQDEPQLRVCWGSEGLGWVPEPSRCGVWMAAGALGEV